MSTENELRSRVCDQARAWLGRKEADRSHREIIDLYNRNRLPGTYAMNYDDPWCAAFVSAVGMACGLRDVILPHVNCDGMIASYKLAGRWIENDAYTPQPGDLIFYDWQDSGMGDNNGSSDHVGIVVDVDGRLITVIEGNYSNAVRQRYIYEDGPFIRGFAVPDYARAAEKLSQDEESAGNGTSQAAATTAPSEPPTPQIPEEQGTETSGRSFVSLPILRQGDRGETVRAAQLLLIGRGFRCGWCGADGDFGPATLGAVQRFQRNRDLTPDGVIGDQTWTRLLLG